MLLPIHNYIRQKSCDSAIGYTEYENYLKQTKNIFKNNSKNSLLPIC